MIKVCFARYNHNVQQISLTNVQQRWCETQLSELFASSYEFVPLRVEASHRRFYRVACANSDKTFILMVSPPELERNDAFVAIQAVLFEHRLPVPEIVLHNSTLGLFVLSDLGQQDFETIYGTAAQDPALRSAIDTLHVLAPVRDSALEPYDDDRLHMELGLFTEWFVQKFLAITPTSPEIKRFQASSDLLLAAIDMQPKSCVHRDYHCRNLLYNDQTLGIVDFQDALIGSCLYDLASLLHDCYYFFNEQEIDHWLDYFLSGTDRLSAFSKEEVRRMLDFTAYQRQLKAIGIFARLHLRDNKSTHLIHIVPLLKRMVTSLSRYPELKDLKLQLSSCIEPAEARIKQ
ncbi:MAG: phosphotransferase [Pseudomonadales bacterium]|nr:phosphotransferase [Pseudomonadales bacterium]